MRFAVGIGVVLRQRTALTASTGYGRSFRRWGIRPAGTHGGPPLSLYSILINPIRTGRRKTHHTIDAVRGQGWRRAGKRSASHLTTSYPQSKVGCAHQYATCWALTLMIRSADILPAGQSAARMAAFRWRHSLEACPTKRPQMRTGVMRQLIYQDVKNSTELANYSPVRSCSASTSARGNEVRLD